MTKSNSSQMKLRAWMMAAGHDDQLAAQPLSMPRPKMNSQAMLPMKATMGMP